VNAAAVCNACAYFLLTVSEWRHYRQAACKPISENHARFLCGREPQAVAMRHAKLIGFVLLLPLVLAIWGLWQKVRISDQVKEDAEQVSAMQGQITALEKMEKEDPAQRSVLLEGIHPFRLTPGEALARIRFAGKQTSEEITLRALQNRLSPWAIFFALTALITGGLGLLLIYGIGKRALHSRDTLLQAFNSGRRLLPFIITGVTVGVALSFALLFAVEAIAYWLGMESSSTRGRGKILGLMVIFSAFGFYLAYKALRAMPSAFSRFQPEPMALMGHAVTEKEAPGLWKWVKELSQRTQALMPENIIVGLTESFFVTSHAITLQNKSELTGRTLYLPLAELALLDESEAASIVGHELGHFSGNDTTYSQRFLPIYAGVQRSLLSVAKSQSEDNIVDVFLSQPAWLLGERFMEKFDHAVQHWSREREFAADAVGAQAVSAEASCRALLRVHAIDAPLAETLLGVRDNPITAPADLIQAVRSAAAQKPFIDPTPLLEKSMPHPTDSHPPTRQRLEAMGERLPIRTDLMQAALRSVDAHAPLWFSSFFTDVADVCRTVSEEYKSTVKKQEEAFSSLLENLAKQGEKDCLLYESSIISMLAMGFASLLSAAWAIAVLFQVFSKTTPTLWALPGVGGAILFFLATKLYWKRHNQPFLHLTADSFSSPHGLGAVPWTAVDDMSFMKQQQNISVTFILKEESAEPVVPKSKRVIQWKPKQRKLYIGVAGLKGMKYEAMAELICQYHQGGLARAEQAEREKRREAKA
jgi:Zn-dependent protease with chaperone function